MLRGDAFNALQAWAVQKLDVPFVDGVPQLSLDDALDRIAGQLPALGGPELAAPSVGRLADALDTTALRLRRGGPDDPKVPLLDMLANELRVAEDLLSPGSHLACVDRVRRVCVVMVCLDKITSHIVRAAAGQPPARRGPAVEKQSPTLRPVESSVSTVLTAPVHAAALGPGGSDIPWKGPSLGTAILGEHLRHLRECQDLTWADVAARMPAAARMNACDIADLENGTNPALHEAAQHGQLAACLHVYGAGAVAEADFQHVLAETGLAKPGYFSDRGPGWPHRYQILEERAAAVLLVGAITIPAALRTPAFELAMALDAPTVRVPGTVPERPMGPPPDNGCVSCRIYRGDLLANPLVAGQWQTELNLARAVAFDARLRHPDTPQTTLLLDWDLLQRAVGGLRVHAAQMRHLADLARTTALQVQVLPPDSGVILGWDVAQLGVGERVLTATWSHFDVTYQDRAHLKTELALKASLPPEASVRLLDRAATGDLPQRRPW
ncbi:Scr1 family TA system antitoxin-like transcriptional regulator [Kitasatospora sp. NPDC058478]|uniref:Scr1 family TA system antitoxin-like transcriptional regulator n=1 Tax=unclassified Kitasatospora TaxID=2633591 RepID=UPI00365453F5